MEAYVYIRVRSGAMGNVLTGLAAQPGIRRAVAVVGRWDVMAHVEGPELATMAAQVISQIELVEGVTGTLTAAVVPPDRVGIAGWGNPQAPAIIADACYVHMKAEVGAVSGLAERLSELPDVAGVAVLAGEYDLVACVAQPWEVGSGIIIEQIHSLPGVISTMTLVSFLYEEPQEDRDQFSAWS
jgi:DNA-binding Lrp family transcriptional regulator